MDNPKFVVVYAVDVADNKTEIRRIPYSVSAWQGELQSADMHNRLRGPGSYGGTRLLVDVVR
ncbi:hypothetical protein [Azospirillum canadense]|uniref:hypothetical protein n=1 Tax=Azospirillum canadense TaxID=403962 RepID=UPI002227DD3E|nr:hypothetical protein [Azospirillum canadense]MCW2242222.1 hypothetical protein [Azospirillum canadense]